MIFNQFLLSLSLLVIAIIIHTVVYALLFKEQSNPTRQPVAIAIVIPALSTSGLIDRLLAAEYNYILIVLIATVFLTALRTLGVGIYNLLAQLIATYK